MGLDLYLNDCSSLTSLPSSIFDGTWPSRADGVPHTIIISGSGIPWAVVDRWNAHPPPGFQLIWGVREERGADFADLPSALAFWQDLAPHGGAGEPAAAAATTAAYAPTSPDAAALTLTPAQANDLRAYLCRLRWTRDYENPNVRPVLAQRTLALLERLRPTSPLREPALLMVADAINDCGDRVALVLDNLELGALVEHAEQLALRDGNSAALAEIAQRIFMLEQVDEIAAAHVRRLAAVDPVEVQLAYRLGLAHLGLPIASQGMLYRRMSQVTDQDLEHAARTIQAAAADPARLQAHRENWSPWQRVSRAAALKDVSYATLPKLHLGELDSHLAHTLRHKERCPITLEGLDGLKEPAILRLNKPQGGVKDILVDYPAWRTVWLERGIHPLVEGKFEFGTRPGQVELLALKK